MNDKPDFTTIGGALGESLQRLHESIRKKNSEQGREGSAAAAPPATPAKSTLRQPPEGDAQPDMFVPTYYDAAAKDGRSIMDVAVFRLSKKHKRAGEVLRHDLPDGYVEVKAGADGMASVWDYDIVLMMISHLTEAMNRHRAGRGAKPSDTFRPHLSEILKFCRRSDGGKQYQELEAALDRLKGTTLKVVRTSKNANGRTVRTAKAEGLIDNYEVISYADNGQLLSVEIRAPQWIYREVVEGKHPDVLTVHPDYFLIEPGIGRFVYRLARRAAGKGKARWSFRTIYERSGSTGQIKMFTHYLRNLIKANDLPEYTLAEEAGQDGPVLLMAYREAALPEAAG